MPNGWRTINSLVPKILTSRVDECESEFLNPSATSKSLDTQPSEGRWINRILCDLPSCVTPAGTSNELDVQNGWEEFTFTHTTTKTKSCCFSHSAYWLPSQKNYFASGGQSRSWSSLVDTVDRDSFKSYTSR